MLADAFDLIANMKKTRAGRMPVNIRAGSCFFHRGGLRNPPPAADDVLADTVNCG
jgi:hypothetical protein